MLRLKDLSNCVQMIFLYSFYTKCLIGHKCNNLWATFISKLARDKFINPLFHVCNINMCYHKCSFSLINHNIILSHNIHVLNTSFKMHTRYISEYRTIILWCARWTWYLNTMSDCYNERCDVLLLCEKMGQLFIPLSQWTLPCLMVLVVCICRSTSYTEQSLLEMQDAVK